MRASSFHAVEGLLIRKRIATKEHLSITKAEYTSPNELVPVRLRAEQGNDLYVRPSKFAEFLKGELEYIDRELKILGVDFSES